MSILTSYLSQHLINKLKGDLEKLCVEKGYPEWPEEERFHHVLNLYESRSAVQSYSISYDEGNKSAEVAVLLPGASDEVVLKLSLGIQKEQETGSV